MILSFNCKETEKIFNRQYSKKFSVDLHRVALRKLWMIHAATSINELRVPPSNRLEALKGSKKGQHSIRINDRYRICFKWINGNASEVEIVDYH